jgi:DNA-directed RNA polymerases I, II, and III subunit RPABC3
MADAQLFDELFNIVDVNQQKYDRVARVKGTSGDSTINMSLDINTDVFPLGINDTVQMVIATTLKLDGTKDDKGWREPQKNESTLADMFDYVCYGRVYRWDEGEHEDM